MAKKATITRIRTLYAIFIGIIALCITLFFLNVFTSADPIEVANLGESKSDYGMLITDLRSSPKLYMQNFDVDSLPEGLSANAKVTSASSPKIWTICPPARPSGVCGCRLYACSPERQ